MRFAFRTARAVVPRSPIRSCFFKIALRPSSSNVGQAKTARAEVTAGSPVSEVFSWASRPSATGGVGLDETDADILQRENIDGAALLALTDADLKGEGMSLGARVKLRAAVASLREPRGALYVSSRMDGDSLSVLSDMHNSFPDNT